MADMRTGADLFVEVLEQYGVDYLFGNPGTTELPLMDALSDSALEYRLALHEDIAVGMAAGYAHVRRYHSHEEPDVQPVGVVNLHVAPGVAHGLANLNEAGYAGAPILVTAGEQRVDFKHEEPILSGDLEEMTRQFTKWSATVPDAASLPGMLRRAFRVALTPPTGPVFLGLPLNSMLEETEAVPERLGAIPSGGPGDQAQVEAVAELLAAAEEPVLVLGDQVARAGPDAVDAAVALAEASGACVYGELFASEINFPTDHDHWISFLPPINSIAAKFLDTDTIAFVGCSTNNPATKYETPFIPSDATLVHVGPAAWELGKNQPADGAIVGDPGQVMRAIVTALEGRLPDSVLEARTRSVRERRRSVRKKLARVGSGSTDDPRASRADLADALREAAPDALIIDESITSYLVLLNRATFDWGEFISGKGGGLGYGLPAAVGATIAERQRSATRDVIAFIGDGSYLYYPQALYTAVRYDLDLTVVIPNNQSYRILKDNTVALLGGSEDDYDFVGMDFDPPVAIPMLANAFGAHGQRVDDPEAIESAIARAVEADEPTLLDVSIQD